MSDDQEDDQIEARRARKRLTDRKSQRHHRERQRAYVKQLEDTVKTYKQAWTQDGNTEVATVLKENEALRAKLTSLEDTMSRIKNLAGGDVDRPLPTIEASRASSSKAAALTMGDMRQLEGPRQTALDQDQHYLSRDAWTEGLSSTSDLSEVLGFNLPQEFDYLGFDDDVLIPPQDTDASSSHTSRPGEGSRRKSARLSGLGESQKSSAHNELNLARMGGDDDLQLSMMPNSQPVLDPRVVPSNAYLTNNDLDIMQGFFAKVCQPIRRWDIFLLRTIDEARKQYRVGDFPVEAPSLRTVLSNKSTDVLAFRLYHSITTVKKIPLHLFLAGFWIQYLYLRWLVIGSRESYLLMPPFMRPTEIERRIPHGVCVGMIAWPNIRRMMVRDPHTNDPQVIGPELLDHLSAKWSPLADVTGDLIGSTDVFTIVEHQSQQPDFWKLDPNFEKKFPQLANCTTF